MNDKSLETVSKDISNVYYGRTLKSDEDIDQMFIDFFKLYYEFQLDNGVDPDVKIVEMDMDTAARYNTPNEFLFNKVLIERFKMGYAWAIMETIAHEVKHAEQRENYGEISITNSLIEKDRFLSESIPEYNETNENLLAAEIEARISAKKDAPILLEHLNIVPHEDEELYASARLVQLEEIEHEAMRMINGHVYDINELVLFKLNDQYHNMTQDERENYLKNKPHLNLEYKLNGHGFVQRSANEVAQMCNDWNSGGYLKGEPGQIADYFSWVGERIDDMDLERQRQI